MSQNYLKLADVDSLDVVNQLQGTQVPLGWRIMVYPIPMKSATESGIEIPIDVMNTAAHLQTTGVVIALAADAFQHPKFINGRPWIKVGDVVTWKSHSGALQFVKGHDGERYYIRFINDDELVSLVPDTDSIVCEV